MVELGPICQQLVFAARPEYLSLTYHYMSGCPKYKGTTCLHIPTILHSSLTKFAYFLLVQKMKPEIRTAPYYSMLFHLSAVEIVIISMKSSFLCSKKKKKGLIILSSPIFIGSSGIAPKNKNNGSHAPQQNILYGDAEILRSDSA